MTLSFLYDLTPLLRNLINMSMIAGYIVLAILILRLCLKKAPKALICLLWGIVGLRLLLPFRVESILSLIPSKEPLPEDFLTGQVPQLNTGIPVLNDTFTPIIQESLPPAVADFRTPMEEVFSFLALAWLVGLCAMLIYTLISYIRVRLQVREAMRKEGNIYLCDRVQSPFILGIICPRIYLPSDLSERDAAYVIAHEKAHLRRLDHIWKPLGFLLLSVYWFNPILWVAYILLCRDIEMACDEKVIKALGTDSKTSYSEALLNCAVSRKSIAACPLAFGEVGVKARIKSVLNYKKPAFWIILVAIIASVVVAICFLTDPKEEKDPAVDPILKEELGTLYGTRQLSDLLGNLTEEDLQRREALAGEYLALFAYEQAYEKGLKVYVWQLAEHHYTCALTAGDETLDPMALWERGMSIADMRLVLSVYHITADQVEVIPYGHPLSSYAVPYRSTDELAAYTMDLRVMLGLSDELQAAHIYSPIYAYIRYDADEDGTKEVCLLSSGTTSGLFTVTFSVIEKGKVGYQSVIYLDPHEAFRFVETKGELYIYGLGEPAYENGRKVYHATTHYRLSYDGTYIIANQEKQETYSKTDGNEKPEICASMWFDIDGDGVQELCSLSETMIRDQYAVELSVPDKGKIGYSRTFFL